MSPSEATSQEIQRVFGSPRLQVELVPETCWFSNVRDHVDKETWDALRKPVFKKAMYRCEICGGKGPEWPVECHEVWQYNDECLTQTLLGLSALCPSCHEVKHIGLAGIRGRRDVAKAHLAKVNGWTDEQAESYLKLVAKIWRERSKHSWKLSLSWLEKFGVYVEPKR